MSTARSGLALWHLDRLCTMVASAFVDVDIGGAVV